jgi:hypothetical protein
MVYALFVGILLGIYKAPISVAITLVLGLAIFKGLWGIICHKSIFSRSPSHYALYIENLNQSGKITSLSWLSYLLQVVLFWGVSGLIAYFLALLAWNARFWWLWCIVIYFAVGFTIAIRHVTSGKYGLKGPIVTLVTIIFLWPAVLYAESRH